MGFYFYPSCILVFRDRCSMSLDLNHQVDSCQLLRWLRPGCIWGANMEIQLLLVTANKSNKLV